MDNAKADNPPAGADNAPDAAPDLRREIRALLDAESKDGIDEHRAKRLRKQWAAYQDAGGADAALAALFAELRERIHAQVALREKQYAQVEAQLQQLRAGVKSGDLAQARRLEQSTLNVLNAIAGLSSQRRQKITAELEALQPELHELSAWRKWGTVQAREKMIREMANIHQSGASFEKIAQRIQQARKEWRAWEKTGEGASKKLQEAFERECTRAYQPCQVHFDAQKTQRQQNSQTREQICLSLEEAYEQAEWRNPDWKQLQQLMRGKTNDWRNAGQSDYKLRKPLQRRFDAIVEKFDERLDRERRRNYKIREKLVEEVEQLAQREDTVAALAELQTLKKQWAPTVTSARRKEQAIWKRFTHACDQVAAKRKLERKDFALTLKKNLADREALCAEIEACHQGAPDTHAEIGAHLAQWQTRWEQLGEAPKAEAAKIEKRYRHAVTQAKKALAKAGLDAEIRLLSLLREKSLLCASIEALAVGGGDADFKTLSQRWESLPALPDDLEPIIAERYRLASAAIQDETAAQQLRNSLPANLEALHALLLQLEILTEVESPAEFSRQRMALQVKRLSAAMGKAEANDNKSAEQLIRDILLIGAVEEEQRKAGFVRFECCLVGGGYMLPG